MTRVPYCTIGGLLVAVMASGQTPIRLGDEFQVNSYTTRNQRHPAVQVDAQGNFVVVWESSGSYGTDTEPTPFAWTWSVQGQRYDANGTPLKDQFQVNTYTTSTQNAPSAVVDHDGNFVVVWQSYGASSGDSSLWSIQGQRYGANGTAIEDEFQVNTYTTGTQARPVLAMDPTGRFVVVWQSDGSLGTDSSARSIQAQRYAASGAPLGGEFQVNSYTTGNQFRPSVAVGAQGKFVVVWESDGSYRTDMDGTSVQGRLFDAQGNALGGEFQVNTYTIGDQSRASVDSDLFGNFAVVWSSTHSDGTDADKSSVHAQLYDSSGTPKGGQFQVNNYTVGYQDESQVAMHDNGDFVVVWQSSGLYESDHSIQAQLFGAGGAPAGEQFMVNSGSILHHRQPSAAVGPLGTFVVVWSSSQYSYPYGHYDMNIRAQRFAGSFFGNGFESGDLSGWSRVVD